MKCKNCGEEIEPSDFGDWRHIDTLSWNCRVTVAEPEPTAQEPTRCPMCDAPRVDNATAYECGSWHTDQPESFVDHCSLPTAQEPSAPEQSVVNLPLPEGAIAKALGLEPEQSGVEWVDSMSEYLLPSAAAVLQLQQVCTEQAERIEANELAINALYKSLAVVETEEE